MGQATQYLKNFMKIMSNGRLARTFVFYERAKYELHVDEGYTLQKISLKEQKTVYSIQFLFSKKEKKKEGKIQDGCAIEKKTGGLLFVEHADQKAFLITGVSDIGKPEEPPAFTLGFSYAPLEEGIWEELTKNIEFVPFAKINELKPKDIPTFAVTSLNLPPF